MVTGFVLLHLLGQFACLPRPSVVDLTRLFVGGDYEFWDMDGVSDRLREFSSRVAGGDASVAFATFVLVHAACGKEVTESRLSEDTVAC